jgi:CO/xanthine dehydrogenase Mo-binding subunit
MAPVQKLERREFIKLGAVAGSGLILGVQLPWSQIQGPSVTGDFQPSVFLRIAPDDVVTIWCAKSDMGQGVRTGLPMIVAEELDADWSRVKVEQADAHPTSYGRMMTVGSSSVRNGAWLPLRKAGAAAREMLIAAAAARWGVAPSECATEAGRVTHSGSGRTLKYGEVAEAAAQLPVPSNPALKPSARFRLIGTRAKVVDAPAKVTGAARYGGDIRIPGLLFATVVHPPRFGDRVGPFDPTAARAVPGVRHVVPVSRGIAVVGDTTWAAFQGARALKVEWTDGGFGLSSDAIFRGFAELAQQPGIEADKRGDAVAVIAAAEPSRRAEAIYETPYLAHATMEPMNCTARVGSDRCEIWAPSQNPQGAQSAAARITGLPLEAVTVHVTFLGCGWGRRSSTDFIEDAVETAKAVGAPVQMVWSREEDMQHDFYRPAVHHRMTGAVDGSGKLVALHVKAVAQPFASRTGVDGPAVSGIANHDYAIPNLLIEYGRPDLPVPVGYWRSVGPSQNTFILESFVDELAHLAKRDPVEFRLDLLSGSSRFRRVLELAAERSGWGTRPPAGRARGVALVNDRGGMVVQIAEVSVEGSRVRVHQVTCAADCGQIIHPGIVEGQIVGSIVAGLAAALHGEITLENGRVKQSNFHDYPLLRISEMPVVSVHLVASHEEPGGVGEPAVPPLAPAVTNALFALTGTRVRRLPIRLGTAASSSGSGD